MHKTNNWKTDYPCLCLPAYLENHQLTKRSLSLKCLCGALKKEHTTMRSKVKECELKCYSYAKLSFLAKSGR